MAGEAFTDGLRRNSVTWWIAVPEAFADRTNPTLAELNTANEKLVLNITCAVDEESTSYGIGASDLNERLSFCDGEGISRPVGLNPEAELGLLRDADRNAAGVMNAALAFFMFPDVPLLLIQRVGDQDKTPDTPIGIDDDLRMMAVRTDNPQDTVAEEDPALLVQAFLQDGWVRWNTPALAS